MPRHFKVSAMSCTRLITICILAAYILPSANAQSESQAEQKNQSVPVPPKTPLPLDVPPVSSPEDARFSDIVRRLQISGVPTPVQAKTIGGEFAPAIISYIPGYEPYNPTQNNPGYNPIPSNPNQGYAPNQGIPGYNPIPSNPNQGYAPSQGTPGYNPIPSNPSQGYAPNQGYPAYNPIPSNPNQGYDPNQEIPGYNPTSGFYNQEYNPIPIAAPGFPDSRQNPIPASPQFNPGYNPTAPQQDPSIYPDFRRNVPPRPKQPARIDPSRPYMRPAPQDEDVDDRSREAQNSFWNQWMSEQLGGPSFWDRSESGLNQPSTTPMITTMAPVTRPAPRLDPNFFKPDGSLNTNRLGMMRVPAQEDPIRDRQAGFSAYNLFMSALGNNFFTDSSNRARGKSSSETAVPIPKAPAPLVGSFAGVTSTRYPQMFDKPYADVPVDFLDENYSESDEDDDDSDEDSSEQQQQPRSGKLNKPQSENLEKFFSPDGKMFQSEIYTDFLKAGDTKLDSLNGKKSFEELKKKADGNKRTKRQAGGNYPLVSGGLSCRTPSAFPRCEFYPRCFQKVNQECVSRESFIGDDVSSICSDLLALANSTHSEVLRTFLSEVIACVDISLLEVLESPSCDDVTDHLAGVLLTQGSGSCLTRASNFCVLLETPEARYNLAKVFAKPKGREDFMLRLLVNLGTHTNMCKGPGANIFLLDLLSNVMQRNTTYTMPNGQPLPVFEP